ncbi:MAG: putative Transposon Tf2-6 polyprotein [Streblomastix strix]|uniref:Putative Transposon Tf2-6 polyprotein n=1 Tax=Streblomastix strix TaxID=222440 RepID=A0A5J4TD87_9EUKA|nr:MAG: putative Transposon Tf2-6 polyprotein [Streblomastix strix]
MKELNWWTLQLTANKPTSLIIRHPDSLLTTDASKWMWGGACKIKNQEEIFVQGKWSKGWRLTSSNQRELAAILCSLRRLEANLEEQQVKAIRIQTDNTTTAFNLRRQAAAGPLAQITIRILNWAESRDIQLQPIHIPGMMNTTADALSRLARSGDYSISPVRVHLIMNKFGIQAQIDAFSTRKNKVLKQYCSSREDRKALSRDGLAISWNSQLIWAHPPIPLIAKCLQKIIQEKVDLTILITPDWKAQFWRPTLDRLTLQRINLGPSDKILNPGAYMKRRGWIIPPGNMMASLVSSNKAKIKLERNFSETVQNSKEQQINQSQMQLNHGVPNGVDMLMVSHDLQNTSKNSK